MMIFLIKKRISKIFDKLNINNALESLPFILQNSRFKYGFCGNSELEFEIDKQLLEAFINFYSKSNNIIKRNYVKILKDCKDSTTRQVISFKPRRNPWDTENKFILPEIYGNISWWQLYEAAIDVILSSKYLGFDPTNPHYSRVFPKDKYLTFDKEKQYYCPTILAKTEKIIELTDIKILVKALKEKFDKSLELVDLIKTRNKRDNNCLEVIIKGNKKNLNRIIKYKFEGELWTTLNNYGFRFWIDSAEYINSKIYLTVNGYTSVSVNNWVKELQNIT